MSDDSRPFINQQNRNSEKLKVRSEVKNIFVL